MNLSVQPPRTAISRLHAWKWALLAALGTGLIIAFASTYFYREARDTANRNLAVIAELKAHEIERWLLDKRNNTIQPPTGTLALAFDAAQRAAPGTLHNTTALNEVLNFLLRRDRDVSRIDLYDTQGHFNFSSASTAPVKLNLSPRATAHTPDNLSQLGDFDNDEGTEAHLYVFAPLSVKAPASPREIGVARMTIDPTHYLYPFIQTWPDSSASGETLMFRVEGEEVTFVNPLQQGKIPPLSLRLPLSALDLTAEELKTDQTLITPGHDYRGAQVLRAIHPVTNTTWRVVAKIDTAEVYAPALRNSLIVASLLISLMIALVYLLYLGHQRSLERAVQTQDQAAAARLSTFINAVPESLLMVHRSGTIKLINRTGAARLGSTPEQMIGHSLFDHLPAELLPARRAIIKQACASSKPITFTDRRDGVEYEAMLYPQGDQEHAVLIATDMTAHHAAETALRESEERLRGLTDNLPDSYLYQIITQPDGTRHFSHISSGVERIHGIAAADILANGNLLYATLDPAQTPALVAEEERCRAEQRDFFMELRMRRADRRYGRFIVRSRPRPGQDGTLIWDGVVQDITARKAVEGALRETEDRLRNIAANLPASVLYQVTLEADGHRHFSYISAGAERILGIPAEALLTDMDTLISRIDPEQVSALHQVQINALGGGDVNFDCRLRQGNGQWRWISMRSRQRPPTSSGQRIWDGIFTDITTLKNNETKLAEQLATEQALNDKLEEAHNQLLQSEKLAAIGQLAAGVAHELNNPIGFVHSNLGTLTEYTTALVNLCDTYTALIDDAQPDSPQLAEIRRIKQDQDYNYLRGDIFPLLEESRDGLVRVRKIVQDLRDFSRTGSQAWMLADLHKGLDSTLNIVANELKYKCTIRKEYGELPEVYCVASQINQVFMNLLVNAAQAIEKEGEIILRSGLEGDDQVWLSVSDNGSGIEPDKLNHIFEPFFTTKPVGTGTGLGLSLVFGIINRHHGRIDVSSEPGKGTTFRITLPIKQPDTLEAT